MLVPSCKDLQCNVDTTRLVMTRKVPLHIARTLYTCTFQA